MGVKTLRGHSDFRGERRPRARGLPHVPEVFAEGLKRNFQVMPGAEWLALLCKHIPDRYEHLVRYVGWYSNRARGERAKKALPQDGLFLLSSGEELATEFAARARAAWARLIRKVFEADEPLARGLECLPAVEGIQETGARESREHAVVARDERRKASGSIARM